MMSLFFWCKEDEYFYHFNSQRQALETMWFQYFKLFHWQEATTGNYWNFCQFFIVIMSLCLCYTLDTKFYFKQKNQTEQNQTKSIFLSEKCFKLLKHAHLYHNSFSCMHFSSTFNMWRIYTKEKTDGVQAINCSARLVLCTWETWRKRERAQVYACISHRPLRLTTD